MSTYKMVENIIHENSVRSAVTMMKISLAKCKNSCRGIKRTGLYDIQVKCCTCSCNIKHYTKLIASMSKSEGGSDSNRIIRYYSNQLVAEKNKLARYKQELIRKRSRPASSMSLRPSKDSWKPGKLN